MHISTVQVMVYTFMSGTQCRPQRRRLSRSSRRYSRSSVNLGTLDKHRALPVHTLSRSVDIYSGHHWRFCGDNERTFIK